MLTLGQWLELGALKISQMRQPQQLMALTQASVEFKGRRQGEAAVDLDALSL